MSKVIEVIYYETPRHGYLKVKGDDLRSLKISQSFSEFSFYNEDDDQVEVMNMIPEHHLDTLHKNPSKQTRFIKRAKD